MYLYTLILTPPSQPKQLSLEQSIICVFERGNNFAFDCRASLLTTASVDEKAQQLPQNPYWATGGTFHSSKPLTYFDQSSPSLVLAKLRI